MLTMDEKRELDYERIKFLYENTKVASLGLFLVVLIQSYYVYRFASIKLALLWIASIIISNIPRMILAIKMKRVCISETSSHDQILKWEQLFFYTSILPFISFAAVVFLPYGENLLQGLFTSTIALIALLSGAVLYYGMLKKVSLLYLNIICAFMIARCIWEATQETMVMALLVLFTYTLVFRMIKQQNKILLQNIMLKIENRNLSLIDPLTQLGNRRYMNLFAEKVFSSSKRSGNKFHVIILDIDHFKNYNDAHGHLAGDELLKIIAKILLSNVREGELVIRFGGEEFIAILKDTNQTQAVSIWERISEAIKIETGVTVSGGLSDFRDQCSFMEILNEADSALYQAKKSGRDRLIIFSNEICNIYEKKSTTLKEVQ